MTESNKCLTCGDEIPNGCLYCIPCIEELEAEEELKTKYCCRCINSDCDCNCIAKQEAPFDTFICDNGEMFEKYEEVKR